jgi:integrase
MTTGARRGELCPIRWSAVSLDEGRETIWLRHGIRRDGGRPEEAELKTHQQRRLALGPETVAALREHRDRCHQRSAALGLELRADAFVFSGVPDGSMFPKPDAVTHRYDRLGLATTFHKLRHYSATELIAAGVDVRTVAGRLGHAGGGTVWSRCAGSGRQETAHRLRATQASLQPLTSTAMAGTQAEAQPTPHTGRQV